MSYNDFKTLEQINSELGIVIKDENSLYTQIEPVKLSQLFVEIMKMAFRIFNERKGNDIPMKLTSIIAQAKVQMR